MANSPAGATAAQSPVTPRPFACVGTCSMSEATSSAPPPFPAWDHCPHGVALHESAEAMARFVELAEHDRYEEARRMPVTSLTVGPEPAWVADAVNLGRREHARGCDVRDHEARSRPLVRRHDWGDEHDARRLRHALHGVLAALEELP